MSATPRRHHRPRAQKQPLWDAPVLKPYGAYGLCSRCHMAFRKSGTQAVVCFHCLTDAERTARKEAA